MKRIKIITAFTLSCALLCQTTLSVSAATPSGKEEVIYIISDESGAVQSVNVVNIFDGGSVTDYGNYSAVKMLTTDDKITQENGVITFSSDEDKVYYQGTLEDAQIPWNISIRYFLDGKEYSAGDIAGQSGALEIRFRITENSLCKSNFYDNYALQASITMDTEKCKNITAPDATIANVGKDKQLTYTVLPGKGIDTTVTADVTDFEMDAVSINGIKLNLNIEIDDSSVKERIDDIVSAVNEVNDGAVKINDGASELYDAVGTLNDKTGALHDGVGQIVNGSASLADGLSAISAKSGALKSGAYQAFSGLCTASTQALNTQLNAAGMASVALTPENYNSVLTELLKQLGSDSVYNQAYNTALSTVTAEVEAQADALYAGYINANADSIYASYLSSNADSLYLQAAAQACTAELMAQGLSEEEAQAYLQTPEGAALLQNAVASLTDEQKAQILQTAAASLSEEQKAQILQGALDSLTEEQKSQIKSAYIQQTMSDTSVTSQISAAVSKANAAAGQIAELKAQLDSFQSFYNGVYAYVSYVDSSSSGASSLKNALNELYTNTDKLDDATTQLHDKTKELLDGTNTLADGTDEFVKETANADDEIEDEIDSMLDSIRGSDEVVSFVSDKNTNVKSVQFVIKTAAIEKAAEEETQTVTEQSTTFWEKLVNLFR